MSKGSNNKFETVAVQYIPTARAKITEPILLGTLLYFSLNSASFKTPLTIQVGKIQEARPVLQAEGGTVLETKTENNVSGAMVKPKDAYNAGKLVADKLIGYTTDDDQSIVRTIIEQNVNSQNVVSFLKGYQENNGIPFMGLIHLLFGGVKCPFFNQLNTEYGFEEKTDLMRKVAGDLEAYLRNNGLTSEADDLKEILNHRRFSSDDIEDLDRIAKDAVDYAM